MRHLPLTLSLTLLPLAGCGPSSSITVTNTSAEEVNARVAAHTRMKPGRWEGTISLTGVPPRPLVACLTPDQVKGTAPFSGPANAGCTYDRFSMVDGKADSVMTCNSNGLRIVTTSSGLFTSEQYRVTSKTVMSGPIAGQQQQVAGDSTVDIKWTGECRGDEPQATGMR